MAIIDVKMVSGFVPDEESLERVRIFYNIAQTAIIKNWKNDRDNPYFIYFT